MTQCPRCGKDNPAEIHTCTPLALRLADALLEPVVLDKHAMQAAAELRRLHAENEALRAMSFDTKRSLELKAQRDELQKQVAEIGQLGMVLREQRDELLAAAQLTLTTFNVLGRPMPEDVGDALAAAIAKVEGGAA